MSSGLKKALNRIGLAGVLVGIVLTVVSGADATPVLEQASTVATLAGALMVLVRELFN